MHKMLRNFLMFLMFVSVSICVWAQPVNNNCANAIALTVNAAPLCGQTTVSSNLQGGEVINQCGSVGIDQSVWYSFVATQSNMDVWIDNLASGGCHLGSVIYNSGSCLPGAGSIISCKPNTNPTQADYWHHLTGLTIGNTYLVQVVYNAGGPCNSGQTFCISVVAPPTSAGYTHPTVGMAGEFIGACMVNTCSGQYYDNGGPSSNYSNNINLVYRTFCPNAPGQCVRANINYIDCDEGFDPFYIKNGPTRSSPNLWAGYKLGNTTITSTDASGCLTFRFGSNASVNYAGWNITLSCVPCVANTTPDNNDCSEATFICGNTSFSGASVGPGITSDGCSGCNTSERFTNWYQLCITTSGTLIFAIDPTNSSQDYDFALYGPNVSCGTLGTPIRCSYATNANNTGLQFGAGDNSEGVTGNGWVNPLVVNVGECYYLMVSQRDAGGAGFTIDFTGTTASFDCTPLPVELMEFDCFDYGNNRTLVKWTTASETNNDYFVLEKLSDGYDFKKIAVVDGQGNSTITMSYSVVDYEPLDDMNFYRLTQVDFDGKKETLGIIACEFVLFDDEVTVNIFDFVGKLVISEKTTFSKRLDVIKNADVSIGVYVVQTVFKNMKTTIEKYVRTADIQR